MMRAVCCFVALACFTLVDAYSSGAPSGFCSSDGTPGGTGSISHGRPYTSPPAFSVIFNPALPSEITYVPKTVYQITVTDPVASTSFNGFALLPTTFSAGGFASDANSRVLTCTTATGLTHTSSTGKVSATGTWTSPARGNVALRLTVFSGSYGSGQFVITSNNYSAFLPQPSSTPSPSPTPPPPSTSVAPVVSASPIPSLSHTSQILSASVPLTSSSSFLPSSPSLIPTYLASISPLPPTIPPETTTTTTATGPTTTTISTTSSSTASLVLPSWSPSSASCATSPLDPPEEGAVRANVTSNEPCRTRSAQAYADVLGEAGQAQPRQVLGLCLLCGTGVFSISIDILPPDAQQVYATMQANTSSPAMQAIFGSSPVFVQITAPKAPATNNTVTIVLAAVFGTLAAIILIIFLWKAYQWTSPKKWDDSVEMIYQPHSPEVEHTFELPDEFDEVNFHQPPKETPPAARLEHFEI
eukprot:gb/GEZN01005908.1/.p1 GENE.gb/GEZN01005908.1/~~gb/GEZN01005908.1/.p1  ORF type:complete len:472 (-),score=79.71 gb/GEZN01005908.1/:295-1710(-)